MPEEYKKNQFCKDIECPTLDSDEKEHICENYCQCTAYDFHDWLIKNNFKIVKEG